MDYLKICNWDKWQTYRKDRGQPPWIKIHRRVMRNPEWVSLTDSERGQLVAIWLLAADHDGDIPASPDIIQKLCFMTKQPNINKFIDLGFIMLDGCQLGVNLASTGSQHDQPKAKAETETETETEAKADLASSFAKFWKSYPKKTGKGAAQKSWSKITSPKTTLEKILSSLEWQIKSRQWNKEDGQYIPNPSTYLNQKRWEDEPNAKKVHSENAGGFFFGDSEEDDHADPD